MQTWTTQPIQQTSTLSLGVKTDKPSYSMGDSILISGTVKPVVTGTPLTIIILDPNYLLLQAERISVLPDGSFQTIITTTPSVWKLDGTYTISAQYGSTSVKAQTTFYFTGS